MVLQRTLTIFRLSIDVVHLFWPSIKAHKNAWTGMCGKVLGLDRVQRDEVVNLRVCMVPGQQMEHTLDNSFAGFRWMIPGCVVEDKIRNLTTKKRCQMTLASEKCGRVSMRWSQVSTKVKMKHALLQKWHGPSRTLKWHAGILLALQNMLTSSKVKHKPVSWIRALTR